RLRARRAVDGADRHCSGGGGGPGKDFASSEPVHHFMFFLAVRHRSWFRMRQIGHCWLPPLEPAFSCTLNARAGQRAFSSMNVKSDWLKNLVLGLASGEAT